MTAVVPVFLVRREVKYTVPYQRFVNTTPNPSATKNSNGLCFIPPVSPVGLGLGGVEMTVGDGCVMAGSLEAIVEDGRAEVTAEERAEERAEDAEGATWRAMMCNALTAAIVRM